MRCLPAHRGLVIPAMLILAACFLPGCSSTKAESGTVGTTGQSAPMAITLSQTYLTVTNHAGVPFVEGEVQIIPGGVMQPFRIPLQRVENGSSRDLMFRDFRSVDGTGFRRGTSRARRVRVTAVDIMGKKYQQEVPFE